MGPYLSNPRSMRVPLACHPRSFHVSIGVRSPHTSIHKGCHNWGRAAGGRPPPFVEAAEGRLSLWMGV
jgi:hypothetical protein